MESIKTEEILKTDIEVAVYPTYLQLANVIVRWNNKVLLIHRNTEPFKDYWSVPGGGIEAEEAYIDGAARELSEEVGIKSNQLIPMYIFIDHTHRLESHIFETTSQDGVASNPEPTEQDSATWKSIDEALLLQLTPGVRRALLSLI